MYSTVTVHTAMNKKNTHSPALKCLDYIKKIQNTWEVDYRGSDGNYTHQNNLPATTHDREATAVILPLALS